jgi:hypothetical protein
MANRLVHVAPQSIPAGADVTVPMPVPDLVTEIGQEVLTNVALIALFPFAVNTQLLAPVQPPPHPMNVEPASAVAVSTTAAPSSNWPTHDAPQSIPEGDDVTEPDPVPSLTTVTVTVGAPASGFSLTDPQPATKTRASQEPLIGSS